MSEKKSNPGATTPTPTFQNVKNCLNDLNKTFNGWEKQTSNKSAIRSLYNIYGGMKVIQVDIDNFLKTYLLPDMESIQDEKLHTGEAKGFKRVGEGRKPASKKLQGV
jgi:hypothetical protein